MDRTLDCALWICISWNLPWAKNTCHSKLQVTLVYRILYVSLPEWAVLCAFWFHFQNMCMYFFVLSSGCTNWDCDGVSEMLRFFVRETGHAIFSSDFRGRRPESSVEESTGNKLITSTFQMSFAEQFFVSWSIFSHCYLINWISEVMDPSVYSNKYKFLYNINDLISFKIGKHSHNLLLKANVKAIQASKLDSNALSNSIRLSDDDDNCLYWIFEECTTFPAFFDFIVNCRHIMLLLSFEVKFSSHLFIVCNTSDW